jgi:prepilin signal peptidase PulO-like enzyme (type II secretory pathway)
VTLAGLTFFILGAIVGSFLNVVALRYNTGRGYVSGRSRCFSCSHELKWFDLLPILSFLLTAGRCRYCASKILLQYPIVEAIAGLLSLGLYVYASSLLELALFAIIFSILLVIVVYDVYHTIIPDRLVYALIFLSAGMLFINESAISLITPTLTQILAGPIAFAPFFALWLISRGRWMGLGDAKMALAIGWLLGIALSLSAITLAFWIGALVGVILLSINYSTVRRKGLKFDRKQIIMKSEIPFAPFLALGVVLVYFFNINVFAFTFAL